MEIMLLGGYFSSVHEDEIKKKSKDSIDYAANEFQRKLIKGLVANNIKFQVLSAPFVGSYPNIYKDIYVKKFKQDSLVNYVSFLNIWGIRNISRAYSLKKEIKKFALKDGTNKKIIVYSPHTPFLEAACYAKSLDNTIEICLIVPDLPQYMNLKKNKTLIYTLCKKYDIKKFNKLCLNVDSFVLLTEYMKDIIEIKDRPYIVVEGIIDETEFVKSNQIINDTKKIVYTGTLNEKFGIMNLINAFHLVKDKNIELIICGTGECRDKIIEFTKIDNRIKYLGQVSVLESKQIQYNADLLVNPRQNNEEYTKYSFPSKNIEYLITGNPVIGYKLEGIPDDYDRYIYYVSDNTVESLANSINKIINLNKDFVKKNGSETIKFLLKNKNCEITVKKILNLFTSD